MLAAIPAQTNSMDSVPNTYKFGPVDIRLAEIFDTNQGSRNLIIIESTGSILQDDEDTGTFGFIAIEDGAREYYFT